MIKNKKLKIAIVTIFILTIIIVGIARLFPTSKAEGETVFGNNNGYGMVTVTYHSNYVQGTAENGEKADEVTYSITTPIYINNKGKYCISFGEYKFAEKQVSSDGILNPSEDENAIDTGFRGYTLTKSPENNIDEETGFWKSVATGSHGPDNIPDTAYNNTKVGVKRIFNDWADGIYQQGDELVLSSSNFTNYSKISYKSSYDANRNGGTGALGDTRIYTLDVYAQWVKANNVYVASSATEAKAKELNTTFGVSNITADKIKTTVTNAITAVNKLGANFYQNYIIVTDYAANSQLGYTIKSTANTGGNGLTITSKYFGTDTEGRLKLNGSNPEFIQYEDLKIRDIDITCASNGNVGVNEIYTQGNCLIFEYGIRLFRGNTVTSAMSNEITKNASVTGFINIDVDGYKDFGTSRASYAKILSGHAFRVIIDRQSSSIYTNKYVYYEIGGTAICDMLLAGPAQGTIQNVTSYMSVKDCATVRDFYGGNQGLNATNYLAKDCTSYLNIYSNAKITRGIYGGGGGRSRSIPFFSGNIYINVCGGEVNTIYGAGAASVIVKKSDGTDSTININVLGGKVSTIYGAGYGMSPDETGGVFNAFTIVDGSLNGNVNIKTSNSTIGSIYGGGEGYSSANGCAFRNGDATITISEGTIIEGNVYGGGKGFEAHPEATGISSFSRALAWEGTYKLDSSITSKTNSIETASVINGKTVINIEDGVTVNGNVYGGGEYAPTISEEGSEVNITGGTIKGEVFGGGNAATVTSTKLNISGGTLTNVYGGGNAADVDNTTLNITGGTLENIYGGGKSGNVIGSTSTNISKVTANDVFGGGYEGDVLVNASTTITSGTYKNVFGGGDQGHIGEETEEGEEATGGNITLIIGNESDLGVIVTEIAYGGGKGKIEDGKEDASDFPTAYGTAIVTIQGIKTNVANYGSKTLGKVVGDVDVIFKDYWSGNSTAKYKTMNGIDRATTVTFEKSYVLLTNTDGSGISAIENLEIPEGSGIKISAKENNISGNFVGGGEIYLDSVCSLTVGGNLTGQTKMLLNPKVTEDKNLIKGGIENAYIKVSNEVPEVQGVISGEEDKYHILQDEDGNYTCFYIEKDVEITSEIVPTSISIKDRYFSEKMTNENNVVIGNKDIFTTNVSINYDVMEDKSDPTRYRNITRKFVIKINKENSATLPSGTEILMINSGKYYSYILSEDKTEIDIADFKDIDGNNFAEITDFANDDNITKKVNEVTLIESYKLNENFRFVINFANSKTSIAEGTYYPMIDIYDNGTWIKKEQNDTAVNTVQIKARNYTAELNSYKHEYKNNDKIDLTMTVNISEVSDLNITENTDVYLRLGLEDSNGQKVNIPSVAKVTANGENYEIVDGMTLIKLVDNMTNKAISKNISITIDMSNILDEYSLDAGNYNVKAKILISENDSIKHNVQAEATTSVSIVQKEKSSDYGIRAELLEYQNIAKDKIQLIGDDAEVIRHIRLMTDTENLKNVKVKIKKLERVSEFEYEETSVANKIKIETANEQEVTEIDTPIKDQTYIVVFKEGMRHGTYRIVFELYNSNDEKLTESFVNFILKQD